MDKLKLKFNYNYDTTNSIHLPSPHHNQNHAILDSGATNHYLQSSAPVKITKPSTHIHVNLPDGNIIQSSHECSLDHPVLSQQANKAFIFPKLQLSNLISVDQLCDDNCTVTFSKTNAIVSKNNETILTGQRNPTNGMWTLPLSSFKQPPITKTPQANAIIK